MRRATPFVHRLNAEKLISIHALHEESDLAYGQISVNSPHISIHALHEESDRPAAWMRCRMRISIHALHEESDPAMWGVLWALLQISIHALHEESDVSP